MPVYVYKNLKTGETFELEQRITESALTAHPETGDPVKRLIQPVGIAFKGSGFYVNDSKGSNAASKKPDTSSDTAKTEGSSDSGKSDAGKSDTAKADTAKSETKADTKTATKAETKTEAKPKSESKAPTKSAGSGD
ncbi:MAG: FmdB family zinc ribbon protein [Trueperaceae bacterium]